MFSPYGRKDYDEDKIRSHQSLLHVLDHAGIATLWRDNQSGCKGVCDGLPIERLEDANDPGLCNGKRCVDEILLKDLQAQINPGKGDRVVVLHQLGNHGPNYFQRYPARFRRFTPTCENPELGQCARQEIVNAYDNALLYTDHFLAATIGFLKAQQDYETALVYVSDHGESLGEKGLFLHGVPYAIAPQEQIHVPVSYTHLDVYKRQVQPQSLDAGAGRGVEAGLRDADFCRKAGSRSLKERLLIIVCCQGHPWIMQMSSRMQ